MIWKLSNCKSELLLEIKAFNKVKIYQAEFSIKLRLYAEVNRAPKLE